MAIASLTLAARPLSHFHNAENLTVFIFVRSSNPA